MEIIISLIIAAVIGYVAYLIAGAVPFLARFQEIVGLIVFLLVLFGGVNLGINI